LQKSRISYGYRFIFSKEKPQINLGHSNRDLQSGFK
jgi:hypothetical protein